MTFEKRQKQADFVREFAYYLLIAIVSIISVVFLPMLSSDIEGAPVWPETTLEWAIWIITNLAVAGVNILIFFSYRQQAKINIREHPNYKKANEILSSIKNWKELKPRSPKKYNLIQWSTKGLTLIIASLASTIAISKAVMRFNLIEFVAYLFTIGMAIVFGYLAMRKDEDYWTSEYLAYAEYSLANQEKLKNTEEN